MKLIIQIPCYNEEETLAVALRDLPRAVDGFDTVEWLVIDDGSTDRTSQVAHACGVDHVVRLNKNRGLAHGFMAGLEACLRLDADVIVNTDADNQYDARCIPDLVRPILEKRADIVVGSRPIRSIEHFSPVKKLLQGFGSWVVRVVSGTDIPDAPSGFRAMSRDAAARLNVFNAYTYTLETIIQAGQKNMSIVRGADRGERRAAAVAADEGNPFLRPQVDRHHHPHLHRLPPLPHLHGGGDAGVRPGRAARRALPHPEGDGLLRGQRPVADPRLGAARASASRR
jgi:glycosyltransferase involved in cell wall biosynthesis